MRAQADGPWAVYADQARGEAATANVADGLAALDLAANPELEPAPNTEDLIMAEPLFPGHKWDVAISYAGEDAATVDPIVRRLKLEGLRVFYANWDEIRGYLWVKDLVTGTAAHLSGGSRVLHRLCVGSLCAQRVDASRTQEFVGPRLGERRIRQAHPT